MPSINPVQYTPRVPSPPDSPAATPASAAKPFSFHDLLDIVNPLQHLPVIGTLYRAITGEHIGSLEKVAGDTLYGGVWGAVASVADLAFEAVTGKDFGSTVLALFTGSHDAKPPVAVADDKPAPAIPATPVGADVAALSNALEQKGVGSDIAQRALFAYRQGVGVTNMALAAAQ